MWWMDTHSICENIYAEFKMMSRTWVWGWNKVIETFSWIRYMGWIHDLMIQIFSGTFHSWRDIEKPRMGRNNLPIIITHKEWWRWKRRFLGSWIRMGLGIPHRGFRWTGVLCLPKKKNTLKFVLKPAQLIQDLVILALYVLVNLDSVSSVFYSVSRSS